LEFISGLLLNKYLCPLLGRPVIWDYTGMPLNIMGIICPQFFIVWVFFAACYIVIDDYLRWIMYDEEKPHYSWWW
jgi:uncharacterized membrane protein